MTDDCERLQELLVVLDEIAARAGQGAVILVEGRRDRAALEALGIHGDIVLTSQSHLFGLAENVSGRSRDIIILTDWDERGEEVARDAERYLRSNGARPDGEPRKKLGKLSRKEIMELENLHGYMERLKRQCAAKQTDRRRQTTTLLNIHDNE
jgi:5S rRNA maturation endonuclease (ribonuclease M5)